MRFFSFTKPQTTLLDASVRAEGSLTAPGDMEIYGSVTGGRIEAKGRLTIHARAETNGSLKCQSLLVEPGARFKGPAAVGAVPSDIVKRFGRVLGIIK